VSVLSSQNPLSQPAAVVQGESIGHPSQKAPPQSRSLSSPLSTPSVQRGLAQSRSALHTLLSQSAAVAHG
jgi:hypothetical protein